VEPIVIIVDMEKIIIANGVKILKAVIWEKMFYSKIYFNRWKKI